MHRGSNLCSNDIHFLCPKKSVAFKKSTWIVFMEQSEEDATGGAEFCSGDQMTQGEKGIDAPTVKESEGNHVRVAFGLSTHFFASHEP